MPILTDYHLHTELSLDADTTLEIMVERAIALGLTEIAITDHLDNNPSDEATGKYFPTAAYEKTCAAARLYADRITIRHGVELAEPHLYVKELAEVYNLATEVLIGSIHYVGPYGVHSDLFDVMSIDDGVTGYFVETRKMAEQADCDVLGHMDYFDRYIASRGLEVYDPNRYRSMIEAVFEVIIARGIALEINTSGYRPNSPLSRPFPHPAVIGWYRRMGGELISIGSDAHQDEHIAVGFEQTADMLIDLGFREYHVYRGRKPVAVSLV